MKEYKVSLYCIDTTDGKEWIAEYPELKYCLGSGKTMQEALQMAEKEKDFYLEALTAVGEPIPEPQKNSSYSGKFTARVSKSLHEKAVAKAEEEGISLNALISEALVARVYGSEGIGAVQSLSNSAQTIINEQHEQFKRTATSYTEGVAILGNTALNIMNQVLTKGAGKHGKY